MAGLYQQHVLEDGQTRVILLQPSEDESSTIECELQVISLNHENSQYEALSYTWGPPYKGYDQPDQVMKFCGFDRSIKANLHDALRRLRNANAVRSIFVDALSIDQQNPAERSEQVAQMAKIYRGASEVIMWLGEDSPSCDASAIIPLCCGFWQRSLRKTHLYNPKWWELEGMDQSEINATDAAFDRMFEDYCGSTMRPMFAPMHRKWSSDALSRPRSAILLWLWYSFVFFFNRTYFHRRWVLQEVYVAQRARVLC